MIQWEQWMDIKELHRQGHSIHAIVHLTGHGRNTVRKVLRQKAPEPFQAPRNRRTILDEFKPYLTRRHQECALSGVRLFEEIKAQGYAGSLDTVQNFLKTLKAERVGKARMTVRFETAPGQQAQADWAEVGRFEGRKVYAFVMVLSFSRMLHVAFTDTMALPELIRRHMDAFAFFGGVPGSILYDNMAQVRQPGSREINPLMADFAAHYGFAVKTHRPYRPRTKGKVERMVDYLKDNFLNGRDFAGLDDLAARGERWLAETANVRVHATTRERPVDLLSRENLTPLTPSRPYVLAERSERKVDAEGFVRLDRCRYSVPPEYVGRKVVVVSRERQIHVRLGDVVIAEHPRATAGECVTRREHVEALWRESLSRTPALGPRASFEEAGADAVEVRSLSLYEDPSLYEEAGG